ncbi:molybdopterin-synthase adenylyltransferase [Spirochaetota bacterium]|nr:molybdopterin-synthase adenylyltransferase [Spirochaetota bacterium]
MNEATLERHARHLVLPQLGEVGVSAIASGRVLVAGLGGLGSAVTYYLATAGVGTLYLADFDKVSLSNLQRQILYTMNDIDRLKTRQATAVVRKLNPEIITIPLAVKLNAATVPDLTRNVDIVVDCLDALGDKIMLHDAVLRAGKWFVHGSALGMTGQVTTIIPSKSTCLRCFFDTIDSDERRSCAAHGVFAPLCGMIGSFLASEVLKALLILRRVPSTIPTDSNSKDSSPPKSNFTHSSPPKSNFKDSSPKDSNLKNATSTAALFPHDNNPNTLHTNTSLLTNQLLTLDAAKNRFHILKRSPFCSFCKTLAPSNVPPIPAIN